MGVDRWRNGSGFCVTRTGGKMPAATRSVGDCAPPLARLLRAHAAVCTNAGAGAASAATSGGTAPPLRSVARQTSESAARFPIDHAACACISGLALLPRWPMSSGEAPRTCCASASVRPLLAMFVTHHAASSASAGSAPGCSSTQRRSITPSSSAWLTGGSSVHSSCRSWPSASALPVRAPTTAASCSAEMATAGAGAAPATVHCRF